MQKKLCLSATNNLINKRNLSVYYHPDYYVPLPPNHSFPIDKYPLLYNILQNEEIISLKEFREPKTQVSVDDLSLVHGKVYIEKVNF